MIKDFRDLVIWQRAMKLVETVYKNTQSFPDHEKFGLTSQIRRAVVSVPSNISEGHGRIGPREYHRFLSIAHGSLMEVLTQVFIAERLGYCSTAATEEIVRDIEDVSKLFQAMMGKLRKKYY